MQAYRSGGDILWFYNKNLPTATTITVPIGGPSVGFNQVGLDIALTQGCPFLSWDIYANLAIVLEVWVGHTITNLSIWMTYTCAVGWYHNTVYDLAPPFNKDGYLVLTAPYTLLKLVNATGSDQIPVEITARAWRP